MSVCSIKKCKNRSENIKEKKISLFSFPKDADTAAKWIKACGKNVNLKNARVCSIHFTPHSFNEIPEHLKCLGENFPRKIRTLLPDAVPTENLIFEETRGVFSFLDKNDIALTKNCENLFSISDRNEITLNNVERPFNVTECSESQSNVQKHHESISITEEKISESIGFNQSISTKHSTENNIENMPISKSSIDNIGSQPTMCNDASTITDERMIENNENDE